MDAPPIQYARTEDGVNIAYVSFGSLDGLPLVEIGGSGWGIQHLDGRELQFAHSLAARRRVIHIDSRGFGLSRRTRPYCSKGLATTTGPTCSTRGGFCHV